MSYNRIILMGRLTGDPELKYVGNGIPLCVFTLAVNRMKQGEVDFIRVKVWNKIAENSAKYLVKGQQAMVEGELNINRVTKDGTTNSYTEVNADKVIFLAKPGGSTSVGQTEEYPDLPGDVYGGGLGPIGAQKEATGVFQSPPGSYKNRAETFGGTTVVDIPIGTGGGMDDIPF